MTHAFRCVECGHSWTTQRSDYMESFNAHRCAPSSWESTALLAVKTLAAMNQPFTMTDVVALAGDPPNPRSDAGKLMALAHRRGLVERLGYQQGTRPTVKGSAVAVWTGRDVA